MKQRTLFVIEPTETFLSQSRHQAIGLIEDVQKLLTNDKKKLELRSQNDIELHVEEVRKRANQIKTSDKEYKLSELDTQKNEINDE